MYDLANKDQRSFIYESRDGIMFTQLYATLIPNTNLYVYVLTTANTAATQVEQASSSSTCPIHAPNCPNVNLILRIT